MRALLPALIVLLPGSLLAQPFSESMMDCAALHQNAAQYVTSEAKAEQIMIVARTWAQSAILQTATEGAPLDEATVWTRIDAKTAEWEARGPSFFATEEFGDWIGYCQKFGKSHGLDVIPDL